MIKTLGQTGLNFIATKFKELKNLLNTKADKNEIKTKLSELTGDSTHRTVTDEEKKKWSEKVGKDELKTATTNLMRVEALSEADYNALLNEHKTRSDTIYIITNERKEG